MALTRNAQVVSEISDCYEKIYSSERNNIKTAIAINPGGIDLRLFVSKWHSAFAVNNNAKHSSVQFFDCDGNTVMTLCGRRTEGKTQARDWIALCDKLRKLQIAA